MTEMPTTDPRTENDMPDRPDDEPSRRDRVRAAARRAAPYAAGALAVGVGVVAVAVTARKLPLRSVPTASLPRTSPARHVVRAHTRSGRPIAAYVRGSSGRLG